MLILGKGTDIEDQDLEKFKEVTRENGIPEENIVNIIERGKAMRIAWTYHSLGPCTC